jgi:hypothetical protein
MSHADHEWARELLPAHLAGGLNAEERTRLEAHASTCAECIAEMDALRRFDRGMEEMFAPVRPSAGLEERVIRTLRQAPLQTSRPTAVKIGYGVAAAFLLGLVGFAVTEVYSGSIETVAVQEARDPGRLGGRRADPPAPAPPPIDDPSGQIGAGYAGTVRSKMLAQSGVQDAEARLREYFNTQNTRGGEAGRLKSANEMAAERGGQELARVELVSPSKGGGGPMTGSVFALDPDRPRDVFERGGIPKDDKSATPTDEPAIFFPEAKESGHGVFQGQPEKIILEGKDESRRGDVGLFYSFRNSAPPEAKKADPGYFRPGDAMGTRIEKERVSSEEAVAQPRRKMVKLTDEPPDSSTNSLVVRTLSRNVIQDPPQGQQAVQPRKIIRSGEMEFEIEAFDPAVGKIDVIAAEEGAAIATINSEKLPNGKVRGTVVVRCPPERLGSLIAKLRALGDLKSQKLGSEDITKQYTDLESRLRAARTMEERLLKIIKEGTGAIKDLLQAERELGEWRTKIEIAEGEKRYYDNLVGMSTLTLTLFEKEIRAAFGITETERVEAGVEVDDVEKAQKDLVAAIVEAKGRITKSDLKKLEAGQLNATVNFEVAPEASGGVRDRLKQLGTVARLDVSTLQQVEGGSGRAAEARVKKADSQFFVSVYNLANVAPRETIYLNLACVDAEKSHQAVLARVAKSGGSVKNSSLDSQKSDQTKGVVEFEVRGDAEGVLADLRALGEVMFLKIVENPDTANVTRSKRGFVVNVAALGTVAPREAVTILLAAKDVAAAYAKLGELARKLEGRILASNLNENDRRNVRGTLAFDIRREHEKAVEEALRAAGEVYTRTSTRQQDNPNVVDSKLKYSLSIMPVTEIPPRESIQLGIQADDVDRVLPSLQAVVADLKGRVVDSNHSREQSGRKVSRVLFDVPYGASRGAGERIKALGTVRFEEARPDPKVPDSDLAVARYDVTVSSELLVATDSAPLASIKKGFSVSAMALSWSLTFVMVGLCFVLPIAVIGWGGWRLVKRMRKPPASTT